MNPELRLFFQLPPPRLRTSIKIQEKESGKEGIKRAREEVSKDKWKRRKGKKRWREEGRE